MVIFSKFIGGSFVGGILGFAIGFVPQYINGWGDFAMYGGIFFGAIGIVVGGILAAFFHSYISGLMIGGITGGLIGLVAGLMIVEGYYEERYSWAVFLVLVTGCIVGGLMAWRRSRHYGVSNIDPDVVERT